MSEERTTTESRESIDGMFRLDDKVAVVSGAGTHGGSGVGNGAATAILFARRGASVILVDKEIEWADATREIIQEEGGEAITVQADVTDPDDCRAVVERVVEQYGSIDVLHNNVGGGPKGNIVDADSEDWQRNFELNLLSIANVCRHVIPEMMENGGVHRQHRFSPGPEARVRLRALHCDECGRDGYHQRDRDRPRSGQHPRELSGSRSDLDAEGCGNPRRGRPPITTGIGPASEGG